MSQISRNQRRAVLDAATIAGLNVLRIMNETAATALCWGLPKSLEFPEDSATPKNALFFDMGHSSTQAKLEILFRSVLETEGLFSGLFSGFHEKQDVCSGVSFRS